jgi:hypothetical protein
MRKILLAENSLASQEEFIPMELFVLFDKAFPCNGGVLLLLLLLLLLTAVELSVVSLGESKKTHITPPNALSYNICIQYST